MFCLLLKDAASSSLAKGKGLDKSRKKKASSKNTVELTLTQMIGPTEDLDPTTSPSTSGVRFAQLESNFYIIISKF